VQTAYDTTRWQQADVKLVCNFCVSVSAISQLIGVCFFFFSLRYFSHLYHSCIETRRNSLHWSEFVTELTWFFSVISKKIRYGIWLKMTEKDLHWRSCSTSCFVLNLLALLLLQRYACLSRNEPWRKQSWNRECVTTAKKGAFLETDQSKENVVFL